MRGQTFDKDYILEFLPKLRNRTRTWTYTNPVDISATIDILAKLLKYQVYQSEVLVTSNLVSGTLVLELQ